MRRQQINNLEPPESLGVGKSLITQAGPRSKAGVGETAWQSTNQIISLTPPRGYTQYPSDRVQLRFKKKEMKRAQSRCIVVHESVSRFPNDISKMSVALALDSPWGSQETAQQMETRDPILEHLNKDRRNESPQHRHAAYRHSVHLTTIMDAGTNCTPEAMSSLPDEG